MIDSACFYQIKHLHVHQGLQASQSAQEVSLDPRTVSYWLAQEHFRPRKPSRRPSKLDPCTKEMVRMLEHYPYAAAQVFPRLRAPGFDGGYALIKAYGRAVRPRRHAAFLTLACAPGACAQGDWGSCGSVPVSHTYRQLRVFVMVLCYSRMMDVEGTVSQTLEPCLACQQPAWACFGGIPHTVMVDDLKAAGRKRTRGEAPVFQPTYRDFATHRGLTMTPWNVGKGHDKGRGENGVSSGKKPFLAGLELPDFRARNPAARHGLDTGAHGRRHGATRAPPITVWHTERPSWRPVPRPPCDIATVSQVRASRPLRLTVETHRYAVPAPSAGHALRRKTSPDRRCLSLGDQLMARHTRS